MLLLGLGWGAACAERAPAVKRPTGAQARIEASGLGPPETLVSRLTALGRGFDGRVGVAVEDVQAGWIAGYDADSYYPQQSVSKLCGALAVFDAVDRGELKLTDTVLVRRSDMSVFNQPIQALVGNRGYLATIDGLLVGAIAQSDNAANDILVRRVGGSAVVQQVADLHHLGAIRCGSEERILQSRIAGLAWKPEYAFGRAFWTARDLVAPQVRRARLDAYLRHPEDGATPRALAHALARLRRGELLSASSSARFMQILAATTTGPARLRAGLGTGWTIAHKTGTGQVLGELATGYNDVALLTAPDGRSYAVAVMIASTRRPVPERQTLMAQVARAVVEQHDGATSGLALESAPTHD